MPDRRTMPRVIWTGRATRPELVATVRYPGRLGTAERTTEAEAQRAVEEIVREMGNAD